MGLLAKLLQQTALTHMCSLRFFSPIFLLLLCFCATEDTVHSKLPPEASFIKGAGEGLVVALRLRSGKQLLAMVDTRTKDIILDRSLNPELGKPLWSKRLR